MLNESLKNYWAETAMKEAFHMYDSAFGNLQLRIHSDVPSFIGAPIAFNADELENADAVVVGIPWEGIVGTEGGLGASLGPKGVYTEGIEGRQGAYDAPDYIRKHSYQYALHMSGGFYPEVSPDFRLTDHLKIMDYRNVEIKEWDPEETARRAILKVGDIVKAGAIPLVFGGDHSIPYPVVKAISDNTEGKTGIIWFDHHYDIAYGGPLPYPYGDFSRLNAENALYRILDSCSVDPANVVIIGIGGGDYNTRLMYEVTQKLGITVFTVSDVRDMGVKALMERAIEIVGRGTERTYITLDVDVMDPVSFPAMKYPEPFGLPAGHIREALAMVTRDTNLAGFDMCCMGPAYDINGVGALTAVRLYIEILKGLALKKMGVEVREMTVETVKMVKFKVPESKISFDPDLCTGCGTCQLMCSLFREGVGGPALSRCRLDRDPFNAQFTFSVCKQCLAPSCYLACPLPDQSMCIDDQTGVRYINEAECIGCKKCHKACPFEPAEIGFNPEKKKSFKCDLCRGRAEGPICVEYCPVGALQMVPTKKRKKRK